MNKKLNKFGVIDLFAGPGGLGEGFSSYKTPKGDYPYKIAISIEKEKSAHATLTLRALYRQFIDTKIPDEYYSFLRGELGDTPEEGLYQVKSISKQVNAAKLEARCLELGKDNKDIDIAIDKALVGTNDCILIGGPPCQAYSLVGRSRRKGILGYIPEDDGRNYLYQEYLRILRKYNPAVFVMENVKGMLSAKIDGHSVYKKIITDLSGTGSKNMKYRIVSLVTDGNTSECFESRYDADDYIIRMEQYGIPQARHRVILLGLRDDIAFKWNSQTLKKNKHSINVHQIIGSLPSLRSGISKEVDSPDNWHAALSKYNWSTVIGPATGSRKLFQSIISDSLKLAKNHKLRGSKFSSIHPLGNLFKEMPLELKKWFQDPSGKKILCNHETRGHMRSDLHRYMFCAAWAEMALTTGDSIRFPRPNDYPMSLLPKHKSFDSGAFSDRFRVQIPNIHASTITSHISKDGHYFIHYDPSQCRSLTVREAARIQTFPDNYFFLGNRTQQYVQVGNAVPPLLANKIAELIWQHIIN